MDYGTLSPSGCAVEVLDQILLELEESALDKDTLKALIRRKVRLVIEQCAMIAEDYVTLHEAEHLSGEQVGDAIAEALRKMADERERDRVLANIHICQMTDDKPGVA